MSNSNMQASLVSLPLFEMLARCLGTGRAALRDVIVPLVRVEALRTVRRSAKLVPLLKPAVHCEIRNVGPALQRLAFSIPVFGGRAKSKFFTQRLARKWGRNPELIVAKGNENKCYLLLSRS